MEQELQHRRYNTVPTVAYKQTVLELVRIPRPLGAIIKRRGSKSGFRIFLKTRNWATIFPQVS